MADSRPTASHLSASRADIILIAALLAVSLVYFGWLQLADRTFFAFPDNSEQFWPWYQKAASVLHRGELPLWDANTLAGHSFVGETQTGVFYPLNLVWLLVLGSADGIGATRLDALVVLHTAIASVGFALVVRQLRMGVPVAFAAGIVYAFSGPVFARSLAQTAIFFGLALLPWAVLFAVRYVQRGRLRAAVASGAFLGLSILAGHFQPALHGTMAVTLLVLLARPEHAMLSWQRRFAGLIGIAAGLVVVALPQIVYSLPYLAQAYRFTSEPHPTAPGEKISFEAFVRDYAGGPDAALSLLNPQAYDVPDANTLFIGIAGLAAVLIALALVRRRALAALRGYGWAIAGIGLLGALAMLGNWTPFPRVLHSLPLLAQVRELGRYSILVHFALVLALASALQGLLVVLARTGHDERRHAASRVLLGIGGLLTVNTLYLLVDGAPPLTDWFALQVGIAAIAVLLIAVGLRGPSRGTRWGLGAAIGAGGLLASSWAVPSTSSPLYPPRNYARTPVISALERSCAGHRTLVNDTAIPRNTADVFRKLRTHNGFGATMHEPFYDFIIGAPLDPEQSNLLDLRCIVAKETPPPAGYTPVFQDVSTGVTVYRDPTTSPLNTPDAKPIPARILLDADRVRRFEVELPARTTVVVSSIIYPGWSLRVNGRDVDFDAYELGDTDIFPMVTLPAGRHTLEWAWSGSPLP